MLTADFSYELPPELIAQHPAERRDESRLLVLHRETGQCEHRQFQDLLRFLRPGDLVVVNDSKVIPARLRGQNARTGGEFELLLLEEVGPAIWWAMIKPGKRAQLDTVILLTDRAGQPSGISAIVRDINAEGHRRLEFRGFPGAPDLRPLLDTLGELPLPPYIRRDDTGLLPSDDERYQTVYAADPGSVAAPTAGLHFSREFLATLAAAGIERAAVTLHVGLGTFSPVKVADPADHPMHEERYSISEATAEAIRRARSAGRRVIAVGTTALRALESSAGASAGGTVQPPRLARTRLFIRPPHRFLAVDALLTNFHLPCSTLLMLASAFAAPGETRGRELLLSIYAEAIARRYRFFSYGDAMLIL